MKSSPIAFVVLFSLLLVGCSSVEKGAEQSSPVVKNEAEESSLVAASRPLADPAEKTKPISYADNEFAKLDAPIDRKIISVAT
ncbi:MAG TPA: hypothetical protein VJ180_02320, partial [Pyrinomonadaceae bacterium]|nr:hypothetical protein [Pyrinomonadaceae bacterium]